VTGVNVSRKKKKETAGAFCQRENTRERKNEAAGGRRPKGVSESKFGGEREKIPIRNLLLHRVEG